MPIEPGEQVGRYRVVRLIAQGGMAEVYRAEQDLTGGFVRHLALKVIRPEYAESPDFREMFLDEARTACTLSHPNIVHIYEVGEADGLLFMAMELVTGETMATVNRLLRERGERFSDEALLAIGINTCSALESVHALRAPGEGHVNLVHRDVSPHNLLLAPNGAMKLIDFGIAKAATNRNLTSPGITKGKAGYFSPEQAMGRPLDGRSDLFSLGITLYKLASGQTPFDDHRTHQARNSALVAGRWEPLRTVCPGLPEGLYQVVDRALAVKPDGRWPNAREMREALEQVALESGVHVGPSSLAGYVEADEDEMSVVSTVTKAGDATTTRAGSGVRLGAGPQPRTGGFSALPTTKREGFTPVSSPRRRTERIDQGDLPPEQPPPSRALLIGSGVLLALLLLGAGAWLLLRNTAGPEPLPSGAATAKGPPAPPPKKEPVKLPVVDPSAIASARELVKEPAKEAAQQAEVKRTEEQPSATAAVGETEPEPQPAVRKQGGGKKKTTVVAQKQEPEKVVAPPPEDAIPAGEGGLRIQSVPPDAVVLLAGANKGTTPVDLRNVRSGRYVVEVIGQDRARGSCSVKVLPERTTRLIYHFTEKRCQAVGP